MGFITSPYLTRQCLLLLVTFCLSCEDPSTNARMPNIIDFGMNEVTPDSIIPNSSTDLSQDMMEYTDIDRSPSNMMSDQGTVLEQDLSTPDAFDPNSISEQPKSDKRGIAFGFNSLADFEAISTGISWWYNWSPSYNSSVSESYQDLGVDWVPMTWNGNNPDQIRAFLDQHPEVKYLLTYNEPNFQDQANLTPAYAASLWPTFEQIAEEYNLQLVGPALNYCGGCVVVNGEPIGSNYTIWMDMFLDEFRTQFGREPIMDFTALHWYDYGLEDQVNEMVTRYGKPLWLTEFALWRHEDWCTDELERDWMLEMLDFLESHPYVHRYAWFTGRRPDFPKINLFAEDGSLTALGEAYINAPYDNHSDLPTP